MVGAHRSGHVLLGSVLTRTEVLEGMRAAEKGPTQALLSVIDWIDVTGELADAAGALARQYRRSHPGVDLVDYVIAATTIARDAALWTRNVRHFPMFDGLTAPY